MYIWPSYNVAVTRQLLKITVTAIIGKGAKAVQGCFRRPCCNNTAGLNSILSSVFDFGIVTPLFIRCREFY